MIAVPLKFTGRTDENQQQRHTHHGKGARSDSYGYTRWITEQLDRMGVAPRDARALASDYEQVLRSFGAKPTKGGEQYNLDLLALTGKEGAFIGALAEFARKAERAISKASR